MENEQVGIGEVKRELSKLVNRVAYGGERIVLTSRGKPKAALVSLEDYERLQQATADERAGRWQAWLAEVEALHKTILERRDGRTIDVDKLWEDVKTDQEERIDAILGR